MKKIVLALFVSTVVTSTFAANKTAPQSSKTSPNRIYPMDSMDPTKFSASSISEFTKRYFAESEVFLRKGEFETTTAYETRIAQGLKIKSLDTGKIYAFEIDSIRVGYNADSGKYEIYSGSPDGDVGNIVDSLYDMKSYEFSKAPTILRVGKLNRKISRYVASNAYGAKVNVLSIKGDDFYIAASESIENAEKSKESMLYALLFPVNIEKAKQYANCKKNLYVFAKLNEQKYKNDFLVGQAHAPTRELPFEISVEAKVIPMDIKGMVLKCSNGQIIATTKSTPPFIPTIEGKPVSQPDYKIETGSTSKGILFERRSLSKSSSH